MKIKQGFVVRKVVNEHVAIPMGALLREYSGLIQLNETGLFLWKQLEQDTDEDKLAAALTEEFQGLEPEQALSDVREFVESIREKGLLEE